MLEMRIGHGQAFAPKTDEVDGPEANSGHGHSNLLATAFLGCKFQGNGNDLVPSC